MMRDTTAFLVENYLRHGPIFRVRAAHRRFVVAAGPEAIEFFMRPPGAHHVGNRRAFKRLVATLNTPNLILGNDGQRHQYVRRLLRPVYSREMLDRHLPQLGETVESLVRELPVGQAISARSVLQRLVAEQLSRAIVGRSAAEAFDDLTCFVPTIIYATMGNLPGLRLLHPRYRRAKAALWELARKILDERRGRPAEDEGERTIADIALTARVDGQPFSADDLTMLVLGPYIAGLDTAANTAAFLLYELLRQPALLEQVVAEVDDAFGAGVPSAQGLRQMRALRGAFLETLRLHPVAPAIPRHAVEPFEFQGYRIEAGQEVLIATSVSHFLPRLYPDPERFDIERHYEPRREDIQPGAFAPFGVGPHLCLGNGQAEIVTMLAVAALLRCARLSLTPADYTLRTRMLPLPLPFGCNIRVVERRSAAARPAAGGAEQVAQALPTLDRRILAQVAARVVVRIYPAGAEIVRQGDIADRFFIIVAGEVEVEVVAQPDAPAHVVNRLGKGDYFGEIGLLTGGTRSATVRAVCETTVMELERDGFMTMVTECDLTSQELARVMRQRIIATGLAVALPSLDSRLAATLAARVEHQRYPEGSDIARQGEPADRFYVLVRGRCQVVCRRPDGSETTVAHMVEGDFFGEVGLLLGVPRTATVRAGPEGDAEVLALDAEGFRALIGESQLAHEEIAQAMRCRLAGSPISSAVAASR
jgi:cytochrome P450/CRP-like cAMP-binding protein